MSTTSYTFALSVTPDDLAERIADYQESYRICRELGRDDYRTFAVLLNVLQGKLTPEQTDQRTSCGYTYNLRTRAIAESLWMYGFIQDAEAAVHDPYDVWADYGH